MEESNDSQQPKTLASWRAYYEDLPWAKLIDLSEEAVTEPIPDDQKRVMISVLKERRQSPQKRLSAAKKQAKKLEGKKTLSAKKYV